MKVIATNKGKAREIIYKGREVQTGIYKHPVSQGIFLGTTDVKGDEVVDRRFHGGIDKACYLYSYDAYEYWKKLYPNLDWDYGMFGENITILGLDETQIHIGSQYKIGEAIIEVSQPRQPCYKLGIRMGTQAILKQFINTTYSGVYVRVLQAGLVRPNDMVEIIKLQPEQPTIADAFYCLYQPEIKRSMIDRLFLCNALADSCKSGISQRLKSI